MWAPTGANFFVIIVPPVFGVRCKVVPMTSLLDAGTMNQHCHFVLATLSLAPISPLMYKCPGYGDSWAVNSTIFRWQHSGLHQFDRWQVPVKVGKCPSLKAITSSSLYLTSFNLSSTAILQVTLSIECRVAIPIETCLESWIILSRLGSIHEWGSFNSRPIN